MADGRIVKDGRTEEILSDQRLLEEYGLELPLCMQKGAVEIQERNKQKPPQKQRKKSFDEDSRWALKNRRYGVTHNGGIHNHLLTASVIFIS